MTLISLAILDYVPPFSISVWHRLYYFLWILAVSISGLSQVHGLHETNAKVSKASCRFALNLLKHVEVKYNASNIVFSPASINILLTVLQQGARKNTAFEINKVLGLTSEESKFGYKNLMGLKKEKNVQLEWGNRCYVKTGLELDDEFQKVGRENFDVEVEEINFGIPSPEDSAKTINKWVQEITHNQIANLIDPSSISPETIMIMINAIFFKGNWAKPYKKAKTAVDKFETSSKDSVQTYFMTQREKYYSDKDIIMGAKWVKQPFQNERFSMVFVLPTKRHHLSQLLAKMSPDDLFNIFNHVGVSHVKLRVPKFKVSEKVSLVESLKELGLKDVFTAASDLSGITKSGSFLAVSDVIHEANVEIDEKGGSGSAASVVQYLRMSTPTMSFVADQPFLFFIIDEESKVPLFAGKVVNPAA